MTSRNLTKQNWLPALVILICVLIFPQQQVKAIQNLTNRAIESEEANPECNTLGWDPSGFGLKDHHIFWYDGYYYLVSNNIPGERYFAYAGSQDLCNWEDLSPILTERNPGSWDETAIWAPFVFEENGVHYMYYTGVTRNITQSIMLATSTDPSDPDSWQKQGMIFQPDHDGMVWKKGTWSDCRDPTVIKIGDTYHLYYTGMDLDGGIIGLATSPKPTGPWVDWASIVPPVPGAVLESSTIAHSNGFFYLFYHQTSSGEQYRVGLTHTGPWQNPISFTPGWAHEIWQDNEGNWYTSYLTNYSVTISPLTWDTFYYPPRPFIGSTVHHQLLPLILN